MKQASKWLALAVALAWLLFLGFDVLFWQTVRLEPKQPELYGPVGFFYFATKCLALALTAVLCVHPFLWRER